MVARQAPHCAHCADTWFPQQLGGGREHYPHPGPCAALDRGSPRTRARDSLAARSTGGPHSSLPFVRPTCFPRELN